MITLTRIERLLELGSLPLLLHEVLANGRPVEPAVHQRLREPGIVAVAAKALALQRSLELSFYAITPVSRALVCDLLDAQQPKGGFAGSLAATATAVRALMVCRDQCDPGDMLVDRLASAIEQATGYLRWHRREDGVIGDRIDTLVCRWQLEQMVEHAEEEAMGTRDGQSPLQTTTALPARAGEDEVASHPELAA